MCVIPSESFQGSLYDSSGEFVAVRTHSIFWEFQHRNMHIDLNIFVHSVKELRIRSIRQLLEICTKGFPNAKKIVKDMRELDGGFD